MDEIDLDPAFADRFERQRRPACQLYLISPQSWHPGFADTLAAALAAGPVAAFQLRLKDCGDDVIRAATAALMPVCAAHDVAFILNDRADLAAELGADGVHLGQSDGSPTAAKKLLPRGTQLGVTCHDSRHLAMEAAEAGADYVAFGAFYPTTTKATTHRPDPAILGWWTTISDLPCVAIGGITADNALPLIDAGADFIAVCSAVWDHPQGAAAGVAAVAAVLEQARDVG